nr:hypothetical protein [Actinosynnema pretiosum]
MAEPPVAHPVEGVLGDLERRPGGRHAEPLLHRRSRVGQPGGDPVAVDHHLAQLPAQVGHRADPGLRAGGSWAVRFAAFRHVRIGGVVRGGPGSCTCPPRGRLLAPAVRDAARRSAAGNAREASASCAVTR